jgi:hypothetical protein
MPRLIELTFWFSNPYKQICAWKNNSMLKEPGTVTARELRPYVKSQRDAATYAAIFNFYTLFVYLVADMVKLPSEIIHNLTRGHAVNSPSARGSCVLLSSSRLRR